MALIRAQSARRKRRLIPSPSELVAREWCGKRKALWSDAYADGVVARFEQDIFPLIGSRPIKGLDAADFLDCLNKMVERGVLETAHKMKTKCSEVMRYPKIGAGLAGGEWSVIAKIIDEELSGEDLGIFALPVVPSFVLSHQWVRELKRRGHRTAVGIYFRLEAKEMVWAGLYNEPKERMTAGRATAALRHMCAFGFEVIIPRSIPARSITSVKALPQKSGLALLPGCAPTRDILRLRILHAGRNQVAQDTGSL